MSADLERIELPLGTPRLYLLVEREGRETGGSRHWPGDPLAPRRVRLVHVISPASGGECRSYYLDEGGRLWLRSPSYTGHWPELDAEVERALDAEVVPYRFASALPTRDASGAVLYDVQEPLPLGPSPTRSGAALRRSLDEGAGGQGATATPGGRT